MTGTAPSRPGRLAFTLVELLVVITIIGLLIAILVPGMRGARRVSKRVVCGTHLRVVGHALRMYLNESNDYLPVVESLPSTPRDEDHPRPAIATVLLPFVQRYAATRPQGEQTELDVSENEVFRCPSDVPGADNRGGKNNGLSYFETEKSSYTFNTFLHMLRDDASFTDGAFDKPVKLGEILRSERAKRMFGGKPAEEEVWLMRDYIAFHGKPGTPHASNYLYVDGRVADLER